MVWKCKGFSKTVVSRLVLYENWNHKINRILGRPKFENQEVLMRWKKTQRAPTAYNLEWSYIPRERKRKNVWGGRKTHENCSEV